MKQKEELDALLVTAGSTGALSFVVGLARAIIHARHGGFLPLVRGLVAAILVGVVTGVGLSSTDVSLTVILVIVATCAYLADDLLDGLQVIGGLFSKDPIGFLTRLWTSIRGRDNGGPTSRGDSP